MEEQWSALEHCKENLRLSLRMAKSSRSESGRAAWRHMAAQWWRIVQIIRGEEAGDFRYSDQRRPCTDYSYAVCKSTH